MSYIRWNTRLPSGKKSKLYVFEHTCRRKNCDPNKVCRHKLREMCFMHLDELNPKGYDKKFFCTVEEFEETVRTYVRLNPKFKAR